MDARMLDQNLARDSQPSQGWEWLVADEEDWPGVNDCGAILAPDREMRFEVDDAEWSISNNC
jgi:hypothetical protein